MRPVTKIIRERKRKEAEARQKAYDALLPDEKARRNPKKYRTEKLADIPDTSANRHGVTHRLANQDIVLRGDYVTPRAGRVFMRVIPHPSV